MAFKCLRFSKFHYSCSISFTTTHSGYGSDSSTLVVVDTLISIFTKGPNSDINTTEQLNRVAPILTSHHVETVLTRLRSWKVAQTFFNWASNQHQHGYRHSCYTYNAMASILSRSHQSAQLKTLAKDITNSPCSFTPGALGFFIRCLGSVGLVQEANEVFDEMKMKGLCAPNDYCYNCLLEAISKSKSESGCVDLMEKRLKEMRVFGGEIDKYTLTPVMQVYCNARMFEQALSMYNIMREKGWVDERVYSMLALSFSKWGEVDKAFELVERMDEQGMRLNEKTFCVLIHGFVKESRVDKALQLFDKMRKAGFTPHVSLCDVLIGGLCRSKDTHRALALLSEMKEFGVQPDVGILTKLISSFSDTSMIVRLLEEILEEEDDQTLVLVYNAVLTGYVSDGLMDKAYHLLKMMIQSKYSSTDAQMDTFLKVKRLVFPNTTSFSIVIDGFLKSGQLDLALHLFNDMQRFIGKPNVLIYNNLINGLCNSNRLEESRELLSEMKESGIEPTHFTYNSIYGCLCKRKDVLGAVNMLKEMRACGHEPWIKHSTLLVKELCDHGRAVEARDFLDKMVQQGFLPDIVCYSAAIGGLIKIQEVDQALNLFRELCSRGHCPDVVAYNILIRGLCKANRVTEAENLLDEIVERGLSPSVVTYNLFIDSWCKNGSIDKAMALLSRMSEEDREPNVITYSTLVDGLCRAERPDDALLVWNQMETKGCPPNRIAYMALIHGLCKCFRPTSALRYFREMEQKEMKADSFIYVTLLSAFLSDLNLTSAFEVFKEMVDSGYFPESHDKNYSIAIDAIVKFSKDHRTSSGILVLMEEGKIPTHFM
ncbi:putative pentatricopeptide repeat-containing protein At5g08310, mitochondrial [Gastrolobium bilobum]|uniref:putative pentatricopeptide repeat-containing protein At5g08310, mitochondrial n=1 Tax=Gastrolobium bilobum TaxID=150636 RepID=UPI002AB0CC9D|nr:putative pentatricopeptide repeat-containing protein At5g08310, mitochondrial [Gastrolobium bilobum]